MNDLPDGWTKHFSKSSQRDYYFHSSTNRKQWNAPNKSLEEDKTIIKNYYASLKHTPILEKTPRAFLNFLKNAIIEEFTYDLCCDYTRDFKFNVLDLGCGDSSDSEKFYRLDCSDYVGVDVSEHKSNFIHGDFTLSETWDKITKKFDVVTCLFACQYAFSDSKSSQIFLNGISKCLSERGRCILICSDSDYWRFSNRRKWNRIHVSEINEKYASHGDRYMFQDSETKCPEWWVHKKSLISDAEEAGLHLISEMNLATFSTFIGVNTSKSTRLRTVKWQQSHKSALISLYGDENVDANSWIESSFYKFYLFSKKNNSTFGISIKKEIDTWTCAVKEGKIDTLFQK
jgi:hypothetical protein